MVLGLLAAKAWAGPHAKGVPVVVEADDDRDDDGGPDRVPQAVRRSGSDGASANGANRASAANGASANPGANRASSNPGANDATDDHDGASTVTAAYAMPVPVASVAAAAVRAAGLDDDPIPGFRHRTRLAGLVPMISARAGRDLSWREVDDPTLGYTTMYDVRATWHFDRLLFDQNELRISALDVSRRRERRRVEMMAIHTYFEWLTDASERPELGADLDAMTDGWFSQAIAKAAKP
ncbi:MAG: hypothetical protein QM831_30870 [Kofleriaceae bacterium]